MWPQLYQLQLVKESTKEAWLWECSSEQLMELERQALPSALAFSAEREKKKYHKFWFLSSEDLSNTLAAKQQREFSI